MDETDLTGQTCMKVVLLEQLDMLTVVAIVLYKA
jgi:hypothetical protein